MFTTEPIPKTRHIAVAAWALRWFQVGRRAMAEAPAGTVWNVPLGALAGFPIGAYICFCASTISTPEKPDQA